MNSTEAEVRQEIARIVPIVEELTGMCKGEERQWSSHWN